MSHGLAVIVLLSVDKLIHDQARGQSSATGGSQKKYLGGHSST